jgi:ribosomal protein S18 acetylase RimI-like enzyme
VTRSDPPPSPTSPASSLRFRVGTPADAPVIVNLVESAYRGDRGKQGWTTETDLLDGQRTDLEEVEGLLTRPGSRVLLAFRGETLVASCHIERQGAACYFGMFSVDPMSQSGGVGRAVLDEAERVARVEWQCHAMEMTVIDVRLELVHWYERRGYVRTGTHKPFPYGDERFGIPKRDDLRFEVMRKSLIPFA